LLLNYNASVFHSIDATKIDNIFQGTKFDLIIFQFPNIASRTPSYGRNPNHILIRKFLKSARELIHKNSSICITTVNSSHYDGVFSMDDAAKWANLNKLYTYPFYPESFSRYSHVNTLNEEESALTKERNFITFIFQK